ncbi:hypothetical protein [Treponema sp.]|uniref:hypothetical protein n=1 Tax=Treponema sp. TaxID=166 RepID=UPI003FA264CB
MKKNVCTVLVCALIFAVLLAGCNDLSPAKPKPQSDMCGLIQGDISDFALSDLPPAHRNEIRNLYGCYWMTGVRNNCTEIGDANLVLYSTAMSFSYANIRWSRVSDSMWVCFAYGDDDSNYSEDGRRIAVKFTKDSGGTVKLWQCVKAMKQKSGPFTEKKAVEQVEKDGNVFYVYDKNNPSSPTMLAPIPR